VDGPFSGAIRIVLLTKPKFAKHFNFCSVVFKPDGLSGDVLLCIFGSIVPKETLSKFRKAYNFHPGPITHPGRDPHHWAIYENQKWFGVTLHEMAEGVDEGAVIRTDPFLIGDRNPHELRDEANKRAILMARELGPKLLDGTYPFPVHAETWCGTKRTRAHTLEMARLGHPAFEGF
jgi:methionyl-tRNA formyltransferase